MTKNRIAILGAAESGVGAAVLAYKQGYDVFVRDMGKIKDRYKEMLEKYEHPLWKEYREFGLRGGHGGMDYLVLRAFVESIQKNVKFPIDVYDTAAWMAITCLSEESIQKGSAPVNIPDFTSGRWMQKQDRPGDMFSLDKVYPEAIED